MFRSPNDVTSTSDVSSSSDEDSPTRSQIDRTKTNQSTDSLGTRLDHQETASESIDGNRPDATADEQWLPSTANEHVALMTASSLEFMYSQVAAERLNAESGGIPLYTRHSPEAQVRGRQMYQQVSNQLAAAGVMAGQVGGDEWTDVRRQYASGLEQLGSHTLEGTPDLGADLSVRPGARPRPARAISGLLTAAGETVQSFPVSSSLPENTTSHPTMSLHRLNSMHTSSSPTSIPRPLTRYKAEFEEVKPLGRGGYGSVYQVINFVDNRQYAIKKIPLNARRLQKWHDGGLEEVEKILKEIRTLAKLDHYNIVRYYGAWIEQTEPVPGIPKAKSRVRAGFSSKSSSPFALRNDPSPAVLEEDILFEASSDENAGEGKTEELSDTNHAIFDDDHAELSPTKIRGRRESQATTRSTISRKSFVQSTGGSDDEEDAEIESLSGSQGHSHDLEGRTSTLGFATSEDIFTDGNAAPTSKLIRKNDKDAGATVTLHIQMSLHPLSLATYLLSSPSPAGLPESQSDRHCFHILPSLKILLAITNGVEYLHSQGIVHRDLKPGNVFLSIDSRPSSGCIEVGECPNCPKAAAPTRKYITPRIGDFGLVADIISSATPAGAPTSTTDPSTGPTRSRSNTDDSATNPIEPLSALTLSPQRDRRVPTVNARKQARVGTEFYRPPIPAPTGAPPTSAPSIISGPSEKLDIFSLGVILFELLHPFSTKMERSMVLSNLTSSNPPTRQLPESFPYDSVGVEEDDRVKDRIRDCVQGMVRMDERDRWGLEMVRSCLESCFEELGR